MVEFNFYFAGSMDKHAEQFKISNNANMLKSWFQDLSSLKDNIQKKKDGIYKGKILVDSGAFTAHRKDVTINCEDYIKFLNENEPYLDAYIQLDQIPGKWGQERTIEQIKEAEVKSWENYEYMVKQLKNPFKLLAVFHQDEKFENLERLLNYKIQDKPVEYICISGAKDRAAKDRTEWYHKCFELIKYSNNPDVKVHCLGCSTISDLELFPFYSSDSSSWAQQAAFGGIQDKTTLPASSIALNDAANKYKFDLVKDQVKARCEKYGIDYNLIFEKGWARGMYNIGYMLDWVKSGNAGRYFNPIRAKKLF